MVGWLDSDGLRVAGYLTVAVASADAMGSATLVAMTWQLAAVPGQAIYAPARRVVLRGSDGVVFVANSAAECWEENIQSFREMTSNLLSHHLDPATMPLVFQYNKRDLPNIATVEELRRLLNPKGVPEYQAVAPTGVGVFDTLKAVAKLVLTELKKGG